CSRSSLASMLVKPNTALTGVPSGRVIGGSAWNARKMKPDPSISTKCSGRVSSAAAGVMGASVSAGVAGSCIKDVEARAIRAHHALIFDVKEDPRMAERTVAPVAGDGAIGDMDRLGRGRRGGTVRHQYPRSVRGSLPMIAMWGMLSTMRPC